MTDNYGSALRRTENELPLTIRMIMNQQPLLISLDEAEKQIAARLGCHPRGFINFLRTYYPEGVSVPFIEDIIRDYEEGNESAADLIEGYGSCRITGMYGLKMDYQGERTHA